MVAKRSLARPSREAAPAELLPLAYRLPNPPASFVGRAAELRWLASAVKRAPVTVLRGAAGVGKSALVLAFIHRHLRKRVARTVFVTYRACDPHEPAALPIVRALMRAQRVTNVDWPELLSAPEGLGALAIDLAEAGGWWVVLDDLHLSGPTRDELLRQLSRYARSSRFLVTTRAMPVVEELEGQVLAVEGATRASVVETVVDDGGLELRALRLLVEAGRGAELPSRLDRVFTALLAGGFAVGLWSLLEGVDEPAIETYRLRVALELGDREALARVRAPSDPGASARLLWASVLVAKGRFAEAAPIAESAGKDARAAADADLAFRASFLHARCLGNQGRLREALALLDALEGPDHAAAARRDAFRAQLLSLLDVPERAAVHAEAARRHLGDLAWPERGSVGAQVARALYNLGRFRDAQAVLTQLSVGDTNGSVRFDVGRTLRFLRACLALDRADLDRSRAELTDLEPYVGPTSPLRAHVLNARGTLAAIAGDLDALEAVLAELWVMELPAQLAQERTLLTLRARLLRRRPLEAALATPLDDSLFAKLAHLHGVRLELHVGLRAPTSVIDELGALLAEPTRTHPEERVLARALRAEAKLAGGDPRGALVDVHAVLAEAAEHELALHEAEARSLKCDVLLVLGETEALAVAVSDLAARADSLPSPRLAALATLARVLSARHVDHGALEGLARSVATAPEAALRARALLVDDVTVGVIDRVVLEAFRARTGFRTPHTLVADREAAESATDWAPGWGIEPDERAVWLASGTRVDLVKQPLLFRLLEQLAAHGGAATKEQLVVSVWEERAYHPLRHDNRLQAAVRKLRRQIEDDAADPRRLITTEAGYALGGATRVGHRRSGAARST